MEHQQDPIVRAQKTLDQQLREIELLKEQRIDMKQQVVQLEFDLLHIPENRIYKSSICRQLYQSREYQRDKTQNLTSHVDKLEQDVEDMRRHRRRLMEEMDTEQLIHIRALEKRLGNLENELTRVRGQRDELQCKIEMGKADSQEGRAASIKEWQIVAETRKQRASTLETELARWLQKCAIRTGSREFYQYVTDLQHHILSLDRLVNEQR
jgi:chromosome segregation ATPase